MSAIFILRTFLVMKKNKTNFQKIIKTIQKLDLSNDNKQRIEQILNNYYPRMCSISLLDFTDRIFSDFIKVKKSDKNWICTCITCSVKTFWSDKDMQNGHFKSRSFRKYRFNIDNCRPQCKVCNVLKNGNYGEYMLAMQRILWPEKTEEIWRDNEIEKLYDYDLAVLILTLDAEIEMELEKRRLKR